MEDIALLEKMFRKVPPLPNNWPGRCFGCAPSNHSGLHLQFWQIKDGCASKFHVPPDFSGFEGIAHGGIVASVLDEAGAWAIVTQLERLGMTQETSIRYYQPVPIGAELVVTAQIEEHDSARAIVKAEITGTNNELLATAKSHWFLPKLSTLARLTHVEEGVIGSMLQSVLVPIREITSGNNPVSQKTINADGSLQKKVQCH